jgi:hypothetical protein
MRHKFALASICLGFTLLLSHPSVAQPASTLTGSWQLTFTPGLSSPVARPLTPFPGLATFTTDGSVVETDGTQVVPAIAGIACAAACSALPVYSTPGHGIWQPGPIAANYFIQFISVMVNQNSALHAYKTVTINGELDSTGNNFSGSYSFEVTDPSGKVIATGSGMVTAQRIPHPLLP